MSTTSVFRSLFDEKRFSFYENQDGVELPLESTERDAEYQAVRRGIALADLSSVHLYQVTGADAMDFLEGLLTGSVARLREERILHTLLVDLEGNTVGDVYLASTSADQYLMLVDGGRRADIERLMEAAATEFKPEVKNVGSELSAFSVDGPYSWAAAKSVFGPEILGLRYMAFMVGEFEGKPVHVLRAGKTGEYGYWILAPREVAPALFRRVLSCAEALGDCPVSLYGRRTTRVARMENHFFDAEVEGKHCRNPYEIGLFWTIYPRKTMIATESLEGKQKRGATRRVIGFVVEGQGRVEEGDEIRCEGQTIGRVIGECHSPDNGHQIGLALIDKDFSYSGMTYRSGQVDVSVRTISMPFVKNQSLTVKMA